MMKEIKIPLPISDLVADSIRRSIVSGELEAGQPISVSKISDLLKVSTTPVKQAFKSLQSEGLLITKPRSGTTVSDFARRNLEFIVVVRSALEGAAAYIAALICSLEDLQKMEATLQESDKAIKKHDLSTLAENNTRFHKAIREAAGSSYLNNLINHLVSFDYSFRRSALQSLKERKLGSKEHWDIFQYIRDRRPEAAEKALADHIRRSSSVVITNLRQKSGDGNIGI
ncbi:MAG: GntR family transcriptional regulator [Treponema sp.]|jgi:DNA-binding GntR family transcriptional regulator|nr:GntR family transcriptional regulator [Treponema sp.]